jgi:enamine deaminase RidA (YjgF/YER057c/UK114 family)
VIKRKNGGWSLSTGSPWESKAGYVRAIRRGNAIMISGTTAVHGQIEVGMGPAELDEDDDDDDEEENGEKKENDNNHDSIISQMNAVSLGDVAVEEIEEAAAEEEDDDGGGEEEEEEEIDVSIRLLRAESQMDFIIDKISGILEALGSSLNDVVRTKVYVQSEDLIEAIASCHGRRFADVSTYFL